MKTMAAFMLSFLCLQILRLFLPQRPYNYCVCDGETERKLCTTV